MVEGGQEKVGIVLGDWAGHDSLVFEDRLLLCSKRHLLRPKSLRGLLMDPFSIIFSRSWWWKQSLCFGLVYAVSGYSSIRKGNISHRPASSNTLRTTSQVTSHVYMKSVCTVHVNSTIPLTATKSFQEEFQMSRGRSQA